MRGWAGCSRQEDPCEGHGAVPEEDLESRGCAGGWHRTGMQLQGRDTVATSQIAQSPAVLGAELGLCSWSWAIILRDFIPLEGTGLAPHRESPACPLLVESPALQPGGILGKRSQFSLPGASLCCPSLWQSQFWGHPNQGQLDLLLCWDSPSSLGLSEDLLSSSAGISLGVAPQIHF